MYFYKGLEWKCILHGIFNHYSLFESVNQATGTQAIQSLQTFHVMYWALVIYLMFKLCGVIIPRMSS